MVSIVQNPVRDQWLGKRDLAGHQKAARVYYIFYGAQADQSRAVRVGSRRHNDPVRNT